MQSPQPLGHHAWPGSQLHPEQVKVFSVFYHWPLRAWGIGSVICTPGSYVVPGKGDVLAVPHIWLYSGAMGTVDRTRKN